MQCWSGGAVVLQRSSCLLQRSRKSKSGLAATALRRGLLQFLLLLEYAALHCFSSRPAVSVPRARLHCSRFFRRQAVCQQGPGKRLSAGLVLGRATRSLAHHHQLLSKSGQPSPRQGQLHEPLAAQQLPYLAPVRLRRWAWEAAALCVCRRSPLIADLSPVPCLAPAPLLSAAALLLAAALALPQLEESFRAQSDLHQAQLRAPASA